mmetsp:Transcript_8178/g.17686  ORF Transcript_8178/g.17686 Transcript_8178/m.17686 type:complete len:315 (+) Transcript_8178:94-1038(+)
MLATSSAARSLLSRTARRASALGATRTMASIEPYADYGKSVFTGRVADEYLKKHGSSADILDDPSWTTTHADTVANAVLDWAVDRGANTYCHWFQPMASSGVRHGQTGQVQNMMMKFNRSTNHVEFDSDGKMLVKGETDGSSYPNGGLRATHQAGGYLALDTSSPIFLRGDTIFIPSAFVSYYGAALDERREDASPPMPTSASTPATRRWSPTSASSRSSSSSRATSITVVLTSSSPAAPSSAGTPPAVRRCATTTWPRPRWPTRPWRACRRSRTSAGGSASPSRLATARWRPTSTSSPPSTGTTPPRSTRTSW